MLLVICEGRKIWRMIKIDDSSSKKLKAGFPLLSFEISILNSPIKKYSLTIIYIVFWEQTLDILCPNDHWYYRNSKMILVLLEENTSTKIDSNLRGLSKLRAFQILYECFLSIFKKAPPALESVGTCWKL